MARGPGCCCCCFTNNVRNLVLILTTAAVSALFANLVLFNFTAVLHEDLPHQHKPVGGLVSLHEYSTWHSRTKRDINGSQPDLSVLRDSVTEIIDSEYDDDEGHPILPSSKVVLTTISTPIPTKKKTEKPKTIFITNSPTASTTTSPPRTTTIRRRATYEADNVVMQGFPQAFADQNVSGRLSSGHLEKSKKTLKKLKEGENGDRDELDGKVAKEDEPEKVAEKSSINVIPSNSLVEDVVRALLYAAPGIGVLIGIVPAAVLTSRLGPRKLFSMTLLASAFLTASHAFVIPFGFAALLSVRLLQGIFFATVFPVIGSFTANWATLREQLQFISTLFLFVSFGPSFSWPLTTYLYSTETSLLVIYCIHAGGLAFFALIFYIFYRDRPQYHPWVNGLELNRIVAGKVQELQKNRAVSAPFSTLLRSLSAWSIWLSATAFFFAVALFALYIPSFLSSQDVFYVDYIGAYAALPFLFLPIAFLIGGIVNLCRCSSSTAHVRVFNTVGFLLSALFIILLPVIVYTHGGNWPLYVMPLTLAPFGLIVAGFLRSLTLVGRFYAQHIVAYMGVSFGVAFSVLPFVTTFLVAANSRAEWTRVYFFVVAILLVAAVEFAIFGRGRSASWAEKSWDPLAKTKMNSLALIDYNQDECGLYELRHIGPSH
ncbi:unnamed protein product [Caenorhabditis auriculariae]|uniref:Major facilitator superfamily (MFS) profile domain-containing protein n=1 Tax=Caenorhabditis auriculariae TaxID=2777116 RepID=A0A8S1H4K2_9PELO|nr:unnamed protein product [Caenorhabditis auriculariae]